jgi:ribosomal protein S18 acetylase RimI-like enzyme
MTTIMKASRKDHAILAAIAKTHPAGGGFTHMMFSGEEAYLKGWIRKAVCAETDKIVGFTCVRHKVRQPATSLYYILVDPCAKRRGIGRALLHDLMQQCPHPKIELNCLKDNAAALAFYDSLGFKRVGESLKGKGWKLELNW